MPQPNDLSRSLVALDQNSTIIAVVEMSQSSGVDWAVPFFKGLTVAHTRDGILQQVIR